jgi:hypothetical protein
MGGKGPTPTDTSDIPAGSAVISHCGRYRYLLARQVGPSPRVVTFILLNPSTADATRDDPTIRRCLGFARLWGCGRLQIVNLFAVRATDPERIRRVADPVGPDNVVHVMRAAGLSHSASSRCRGPVVCGWGVRGGHLGQDATVLGWLRRLGVRPLALGITRDGHPLYVRNDAEPVPYERRRG